MTPKEKKLFDKLPPLLQGFVLRNEHQRNEAIKAEKAAIDQADGLRHKLKQVRRSMESMADKAAQILALQEK